jgi:hypothetical protein
MIAGACDDQNEARSAEFWQDVAKLVEAGEHPHRNVLARGIAQHGVPQGAASLYVACMIAGALNRRVGNPGAKWSVLPAPDVLRAEYESLVADFTAQGVRGPKTRALDELKDKYFRSPHTIRNHIKRE